jgi:tetratricopeptide (TPR) repeat protein
MPTVTRDDALQMASQHVQAGRLAEAESIFRAILGQNPDDADALYGLSAVAHHVGHPDSLALLERSLTLRPDNADAWVNYGNLLQNARRWNEAANAFRRAVSLAPTMAEAYNGLASTMAAMGRSEDAIATYEVAVRLKPESALMISNLGNAYFDADRVETAIETHRRAIAADPKFPEAYNNLAVALQELARYDEAMDSAKKAIELKTQYAEAHQNVGLLHLMHGDFAAGWPEYEWRWKRADMPGPRNIPQPRWDGSAGTGTVLIHSEQGLGDTLQFVRYLPRVRQLGWRIVVECVHGQESILQDSAELLGIDRVIGRPLALVGVPMPPSEVSFDIHLPMMSLPLALKEFDPASPQVTRPPYLVVNAERRARWQSDPRIREARGVKVGLVWAGRPQHRADRKRSMKLSQLGPLAIEGVSLFSLQVGDYGRTWGSAAGREVPFPIIDLGADLHEFADTAAAMAEMDLIITVDTAPAHLAGALNRPVWMLLSHVADFRWLLDRTDSPWYPSMRLYRQPARGDWPGVVATVAADLASLAESHREPNSQTLVTAAGGSSQTPSDNSSDPGSETTPELSCRH